MHKSRLAGYVIDCRVEDLEAVAELIALPAFAIFMVAIALLQASHATYYALGSLHWRALGLGEARIGAFCERLDRHTGVPASHRIDATRSMSASDSDASFASWSASLGPEVAASCT